MNTFADLTRLRWLDLSDNQLRVIPHRAFYGLTLQHLFLNGNRDIRLLPGSFEGLVTSGLYLHDCAVKVLEPDTLAPLNGTLVNLWLNGNRLTAVDRSLAPVFAQLSHLRLGANPLHCGCETLWLKQLYDRHGGATFRGAEPPTCWTPARLRGTHFDQLGTTDLHCSAPAFGNVDAVLDARGTGRLRCSASGQPAPIIYWIRPSGRTRRFNVPTWRPSADVEEERRRDEGRNEGTVSINRIEAESGLYICVAKNDVGNVTLTMNLSWPGPRSTSEVQSIPPGQSSTRSPWSSQSLPQPHRPAPSLSVIDVPADHGEPPDGDDDLSGQPQVEVVDGGVRLFSVSELVAAVVGTHLCTVLLFVTALVVFHLVRSRRRKRTEAVDNLHVCDALLNKASLECARYRTPARTHQWPVRPGVNYDVS